LVCTVYTHPDLAGHDNRDDEPIDGDSLAEDHRDQVLGLDAGGLHSAPHDGGAGGIDPQPGSYHCI